MMTHHIVPQALIPFPRYVLKLPTKNFEFCRFNQPLTGFFPNLTGNMRLVLFFLSFNTLLVFILSSGNLTADFRN